MLNHRDTVVIPLTAVLDTSCQGRFGGTNIMV